MYKNAIAIIVDVVVVVAVVVVVVIIVATFISTHVYATFQTVNLIKKLFENFN